MISSKLTTILLFYGLLNYISSISWLQPVAGQMEPCVFKESDLSSACPPCSRDDWLEMVMPSAAGAKEMITNPKKTCFNNDPITLYHENQESVGDSSTVMATGEYKVTANHGPQGFVLRKEPFFRYAYVDPPAPGSPPQDDLYLDLNDVRKYYVRTDAAGTIQATADVQLLEWPGATAKMVNEQVNLQEAQCTGENKPDSKCRFKKWMLEFERDNGKIQHYPCNAEDGTNIAAVASIQKNDFTINPLYESSQRIWLAHGNQSLFDNYVLPLYVPQYILAKMAKTEGSICKMEATLWDLRTVMDFTFTRNRLVLGMKCGVLLVGGLASSNLTFSVASLRSERGSGYNLFPEPVNKVSSSTCCLSLVLCGDAGGLVAAYSFNESRQADEDKFIYVSFDRGDTFEKKIIASAYSPINLIKALYKLYGEWYDYYEILHNPDDDDLEDDEDDELLKTLRQKSIWQTSLTEEREKLFSIGTASGKKNATLSKIVQIFEHRVKKRQDRRNGELVDLAPDWVNKILNETRARFGWDSSWKESDCANIPACEKMFENDRAVDWLLNDSNIHVKTPKRKENEPFCKEIVSLLIIPEERHLMALCLVGYEKLGSGGGGSAPPPPPPTPPASSGYFALYNFPIKRNLPLIYGYRVSQRIFTCNYIVNTMDPMNNFTVQPEIVRIQGTATIFVINCDGVIYLSTNFGNTLFNTAFYYEQETIEKYCKKDGNYVAPLASNGICEDEEGRPPPTPTTPRYLRTFHLCALNVPPVYATDASGYRLLITFGRFYALAAVAYNRETRLIVGEILREVIDYDERFENLLFPAIDRNGDTVLTISLSQAYSIPSTKFKDPLYKEKHGLRLVQMPLPYNKDARNFDNSNLAMCKQALQQKFGFTVCKTSSYSIYPQRLDMDIGDKQYVQVEVKDEDPFLPLWIFSSNENSVEVKAYHSLREGSAIPNMNVHNWKLEIIAKPNNKSDEEGESFVDAFFGSDYNKLNEYSTQISFVNRPNARCHVRPSSTINVQIGCRGKRLIAYEDKYRPQCKHFRNNFNYTLRKGKYDPDLANLWIQSSSNQSRSFFKINSEGDLHVTYDYVDWGCPLEPFEADKFIPDLRVVEENSENENTTVRRFEGKFILIEIFGATGFSYTKSVRDANCEQAPQYLAEQTAAWKHRQRLFHIAAERLKFPKTKAMLDALQSFDEIRGNKIFKNLAITRHINIWNRANYLSCHNTVMGQQSIPDDILNREYEVMKTRKHETHADDTAEELDTEELEEEKEKSANLEDSSLNEILWTKEHPRVYLFLAVAVDEYDSLCDYQTMFGVSLKTIPDMNDLHSFLIFLFFLLFWIILVCGGYNIRKRYLRITYMEQAKHDRLEQAAWSIIYRYEKLIHGNAMDALFHTAPEADQSTKMNLAARNAHDKRKAELRMKKTHIMAQEQARHERLQKVFQKQ